MRTTSGRPASGAVAVRALRATESLETARWATGLIRFWSGGAPGPLTARGESETRPTREGGDVAVAGGVDVDGWAAVAAGVTGVGLGSGVRAVRAAARVAVTGPEVQVTGQPPTAATGSMPATALVTKTSLALASSSRVS